MEKLSQDALSLILNNFSTSQILLHCTLNKKFLDICRSEAFWRIHCDKYYGITQKREDESWKKTAAVAESYLRQWLKHNIWVPVEYFSYIMNHFYTSDKKDFEYFFSYNPFRGKSYAFLNALGDNFKTPDHNKWLEQFYKDNYPGIYPKIGMPDDIGLNNVYKDIKDLSEKDKAYYKNIYEKIRENTEYWVMFNNKISTMYMPYNTLLFPTSVVASKTTETQSKFIGFMYRNLEDYGPTTYKFYYYDIEFQEL